MSCEGCASKVDKAIRGVKGVKDVKVDLKSESAEVVLASASVKADALVKAVVKAGYKAEVGEKPAGAKTDKKESCCSEEEKKKEGKCDGNCSKETKEKKKAAGKS
jgi:Cu+-exporting ATPase